MKELVVPVVVFLVILVLLILFCLCKLNFRSWESFKTTVFDITGIENDDCVGHVGSIGDKIPDKLKQKCDNIQFDPKGYRAGHRDRIFRHNKGEKCLNGCMFNWKERREILYKLLSNVIKICKKLDLEWVFYYGGLLGWYRNRELIPWDPDIDILMPYSVKDKIKKRGIIYEDDDTAFILRSEENDPIIGSFIDKQSFIYCDIFYWKTKGDTVNISWMESSRGKHMKIKHDDFFPFKTETIGSEELKIPVPNNIEINLKARYKNINKVPYKYKDNKWVKS